MPKITVAGVKRRAKSMNENQIKQIIRSLEGTTARPQIIEAWQDALKRKEQKAIITNNETGNRESTSIDDLVVEKYIRLKESAKRRGKDFNLSLGDVRRLITRKRCAYTGVTMTDYRNGEGTQITIDRFDPNLGYVKGNVYAVSAAANHAKNVVLETQHKCKMTAKQLLKMCETLCSMGFDELNKA